MEKVNRTILKGGCDITATSFYLKGKFTKESDINTLNNGVQFYSGHSSFLNLLINHHNEIDNIIAHHYIDPAFAKSEILNPNNKLFIFSIISEGGCGCYRAKDNKYSFPYANPFHNETCDSDCKKDEVIGQLALIDKKDKLWLKKNFNFLGRTPINLCLENYKNVVKTLPKDAKICFILGPYVHGETKEESMAFAGVDEYFEELNRLLVSSFSNDDRVSFVDPNKYILKTKRFRHYFYNFKSITHYKRVVYYKIARELSKKYKGFICVCIKREIVRHFRRLRRSFIRIFLNK